MGGSVGYGRGYLTIALRNVLEVVGEKLEPSLLNSILPAVTPLLTDNDELVRDAATDCISVYSRYAPIESISQFLANSGKDQQFETTETITTARIVSTVGSKLDTSLLKDISVRCVTVSKKPLPELKDASAQLACAICMCCNSREVNVSLFQVLATLLNDSSNDVKLTSLLAVKKLAKSNKILNDDLSLFIPPLMELARSKGLRVKIAAERALLHLINPNSSSSRLTICIEKNVMGNAKSTQLLKDFSTRILSKLDATSDEE